MAIALDYRSDFRAAAVAASAQLLHHQSADPVEAGVSYCILADSDGAEQLRGVARQGKFALVIGLGGVIAGGVMGLIVKARGIDATGWALLAVAVACTFTGIAALVAMVYRMRAVARRCVLARLSEIPAGAIRVNIENAATYSQMKMVPDDAGILLLHPEQRCIQLEGMSHRYLVHADDLVDMTLAGGPEGRSVRVVYRIGDVNLGITIVPDGITQQVLAGITGNMGSFFDQIRQCIR